MNLFLQKMQSVFVVTTMAFSSQIIFAASTQAFRIEQEATSLAKSKIINVLQKYCGESCELISVETEVDEQAYDSEELGFESIAGDSTSKINVSRMTIDIQVDDRVTSQDQERLGRLVSNSVKTLSPIATVRWSSVAFPQIGVSAEVEDRLKSSLNQRIQSAVQQTIDSYCPQECVLANIGIDGKLISPDQARNVSERELVREKGGRGLYRIENIDIDLSIDEKLPEGNRSKIYNLIKAKTKFAYPVNVNVSMVDFPESAASKATQDPWGLDRLRQTLQIFRDLASTKEIITNTTENSNNVNSSMNSSSNISKETLASEKTESKESKENTSHSSKEKSLATETNSSTNSNSSEKSSEISASEKKQGSENTEYMMYIAGFIVLAAIIAVMIMRFASASRDARIMMESMPNQQNRGAGNQNAQGDGQQGANGQNGAVAVQSPQISRELLSVRLKIENLKEDLLKIFYDNPKVARDTFTRMLQEEGVEQTSKYVHVFGPMIIFDMMNDPNLQRDLHDLSEYYHKATFSINDEQMLELLNSLKIKVTASEIRLMTRKRAEQFDFLQNLDASQVFALVVEEKPHVQSVVLTQLDHNRRRSVFDMYEGDAKVALMRELCRGDAIPKDYLANVAKALHKKVLSRSDFDTEQLRSSEIIIDLLEKSTLADQRALMADLVQTNPAATRAIKLKLVTVEMLPYIKDGHLLEIVMGLERDDLLTFLLGSPEHIRELLLAKAPAELAQSWMEDMETVAGIEEAKYRLAELRILGRVRNLANSGAIRLLDINDRIFAAEHLDQVRRKSSQIEMALSRNSVAA